MAGYAPHDARSTRTNALEVVLGKLLGCEKATHEPYRSTAGMEIILYVFGRDSGSRK